MSTPCIVGLFAKQYAPTGVSIRVECEGKPEQIGKILAKITDENEIIHKIIYGGDALILTNSQKIIGSKNCDFEKHDNFQDFMDRASAENVDYFYVFRDGAWENWKFYEIEEPKLLEYKPL